MKNLQIVKHHLSAPSKVSGKYLQFRLCLLALCVGFANFVATAQTKEEKLHELLMGYCATNEFNGTALVVQNGKILLNQGYGFANTATKSKNYSHTVFQIGSITKQFTAAIILKLEEEGKLKVTDKLAKYFPTYPKGDSITIHHLLSHTSGIYNYTSDGQFMQGELDKPITQAQMLALFENKPLAFAVGSQMQYSNSNFMLLGYIIEKVMQQSYEKTVRDYLFKPLQMKNSGFDYKNLTLQGNRNKALPYFSIKDEESFAAKLVDSTISYAAGGIYSTTEDMLKWHEGLLKGKVLKAKSLEKAFTPYKNNFGYGWVADSVYGQKAVYHNGSILGFTSNIYRIPADNTCVILLANIGTQKIDQITKDLLAVVYEKPYKIPQKKVDIGLERSKVKKCLGTFEFNASFKINVFTAGKTIYAQRMGDVMKMAVFPISETEFYLAQFDAVLEFSQEENNEYKQVVLHQGGRDMTAQRTATTYELYDTILKMDNLFSESINTKDIEKLKNIFSPAIEFFHDQTGKTDYNQNIKIFTDNFAAKNVRRELQTKTLEVYPIGNEGAIQIGVHNFYITENGQERWDSSPKFMHIWENKNGVWKMVKVVSYAH